MTFPIGFTTQAPRPSLAPARPPCTCSAQVRECPACRAWQQREPRPRPVSPTPQALPLAIAEQGLAGAKQVRAAALAAYHAGQGSWEAYKQARAQVEKWRIYRHRALRRAHTAGA